MRKGRATLRLRQIVQDPANAHLTNSMTNEAIWLPTVAVDSLKRIADRWLRVEISLCPNGSNASTTGKYCRRDVPSQKRRGRRLCAASIGNLVVDAVVQKRIDVWPIGSAEAAGEAALPESKNDSMLPKEGLADGLHRSLRSIRVLQPFQDIRWWPPRAARG